jgi:hypothetical protein
MKRIAHFVLSTLAVAILGGCAEPPRNDFLVGTNCKANACRAAGGLPLLQAGSAWGAAARLDGEPLQNPLIHPLATEQRKRVAACLKTCAPDYPEIDAFMKNVYFDPSSDDGFRVAWALDPLLRNLPKSTFSNP